MIFIKCILGCNAVITDENSNQPEYKQCAIKCLSPDHNTSPKIEIRQQRVFSNDVRKEAINCNIKA